MWYNIPKLLIMNGGSMEVITGDTKTLFDENECIITPLDIPVGMAAEREAIYTEIGLRRDTKMNNALKAGEVIKLSELVR